jgi:outer membrane protein OmpA-like peptidoglycan-associated protein
MRFTITIAMVAIMVLTAHTASAAASKEENIGVGSGAIVGALAGGPVGFIIGAAIGGKLGDSFNNKSDRIESLQDSLQDSQVSVATLQRNTIELNDQIEHLQNVAQPELVNLMQAGIDMDLLFRTDEFALTDMTGSRLSQMAGTVSKMSGIRIQLDGFADERGNAEYNQTLSRKRVEFVRDLFVTAGVHPERISISAHGESVAQAPDVDSYALERRVSVKLSIDNAQSVASNPQ